MEKKVVITNYDLINILAWFEKSDGWYKTASLSIQIRRKFKKIQSKLNELKKNFDSQMQTIETVFSDGEYSEVSSTNPKERKVKPEYIDDFRRQKYGLLAVKSELKFEPISCDMFIDIECDDSDYQFLDLFLCD